VLRAMACLKGIPEQKVVFYSGTITHVLRLPVCDDGRIVKNRRTEKQVGRSWVAQLCRTGVTVVDGGVRSGFGSSYSVAMAEG
jgi:hypothetical protein